MPAKRHRKYFQQNHRRKLSQPKEGNAYEDTRAYRTPKKLDHKKVPSPHNNQITKPTE